MPTPDPALVSLLHAYAEGDCPQDVLADWLEEHGDARAVWVRVLCMQYHETYWWVTPFPSAFPCAAPRLDAGPQGMGDRSEARAAHILRHRVLALFSEYYDDVLSYILDSILPPGPPGADITAALLE